MIERSLFAEPRDSTNKNINSKHSLPRGRSHDLTQTHHTIQTQSFSACTLHLRRLPVLGQDNSLLMTQMTLLASERTANGEKESFLPGNNCLCLNKMFFFCPAETQTEKKTAVVPPQLLLWDQLGGGDYWVTTCLNRKFSLPQHPWHIGWTDFLSGQDPTPKMKWSELSQTALSTRPEVVNESQQRSCRRKQRETPSPRTTPPPASIFTAAPDLEEILDKSAQRVKTAGSFEKGSTKWWSQLSWDSSAGGNAELRIWTAVENTGNRGLKNKLKLPVIQ